MLDFCKFICFHCLQGNEGVRTHIFSIHKEVFMKVLTRLLILVAVTLLVPVLGQAAPVTVKFMSSDADLPAAFVDKFNKENPDKITIVRTEPDYTKMVAEAASGNASDLINIGEGSDLAYYVPRGLFKDITSYLQKSKILKLSDID